MIHPELLGLTERLTQRQPHKYKCETASSCGFFLDLVTCTLIERNSGTLAQLFIKITLKQIRRINLTCSPRRKNWILQYLLHEVLRPLNHKINVIDLEATLEVLKELLEEVHFQIAGLHFHRVEWQVHKLIYVLHSSRGRTGFERKQPEVSF